MRLRWPRSLFARLWGIATLSTLVALLVAGVAIDHVLERFVIHGFDQQLDAQIGSIARAVRRDGGLDPARIVSLPLFDQPGSGWGWQVDGPGDRHQAHGLALVGPRDAPLPPPPPAPDRPADPADQRRPHPGDGRTASGEPVHYRALAVPTRAGMVWITAGGPRRIMLAPLNEALVPLLGSLALLGVGLGLATIVQLRVGLRPLRAMQASLAEVRAGRRRHVATDQPDELAPLARELNALIDQNEAGLEQARRHVANLAHGLKTPLAALALRLREDGRDPDGTLGQLVARIDRHVRHHLGRARAAGGATLRARTPLAPVVADLFAVFNRLHRERAIAGATFMPAGMAVTIDRQDLDEILGNLLDNAWRHAAGRVVVTTSRTEGTVVLLIEDDGPGVPDTALGDALHPGRRLDERGDGHGFGLPIARELVELNGGTLALARSTSLGGLCVRLLLPAAQ